MLGRSNFVMLCLCRDAKLPELFIQIWLYAADTQGFNAPK